MHWIIQSNLVSAEDALRLRQALDRLDTPYTDVKLIPIVRQLEHVPQVEGPVFVYGTTYVHRAAYDQGWHPGYIGGEVTHEEILAGYGSELLNSDITYSTLGELTVTEPVFARPDSDGKLFTGTVLFPGDENALRQRVLREQGQREEAALCERIVLSSPKPIHAEHRCLVVDGQVVTASTYRRGGRVLYDGRVDEAITRYAQAQVDRFNPELGFALDVAQTEEGLKIIEINALSSCGLYACDLLRFADAVNQMCKREFARERTAKTQPKGP